MSIVNKESYGLRIFCQKGLHALVPNKRRAHKRARKETKVITTNIRHPGGQNRIQNNPKIHQTITHH